MICDLDQISRNKKSYKFKTKVGLFEISALIKVTKTEIPIHSEVIDLSDDTIDNNHQ